MKSKLATVSAKIPKELKDELERRGLRISDAIRRGMEIELRELRTRDLESLLGKVDLSKVSEEQIVRDVRATREEKDLT
ncbi:MAG: CopG family transcriptional regulator [Nitrososphaerales archaeon]|jgi:hypothetical protein